MNRNLSAPTPNGPVIAGILSCPDCDAEIAAGLDCQRCGRDFQPAADGIVDALPTDFSAGALDKNAIQRLIDSGQAKDPAGQVVLYEKAFHDEQAAHYDKLFADPMPVHQYYQRLVRRQIHGHIRGKGLVVDLCCGTGKSSMPLAESGMTVVAMDVSREMLRLYKRKCDQAKLDNVIFIHADASRPPLRARSCPAITLIGGLHHIPDRAGCLERCSRSLKDGGVLILHEPLRTGKVSKLSAVLEDFHALTNPGRMWRALQRRLGFRRSTAETGSMPPVSDFTPYEKPFSSPDELLQMLPRHVRPILLRSQGALSFREFEPHLQNPLGKPLAHMIVRLDDWLSTRNQADRSGDALFAVCRKEAS